jgi:DNA polymerase-3 subunit beta
MKFKISVSDFQYAMRLLRGITPSSASAAELAGVLISANGSLATFTATNPEVTAKAVVKIEPSREGEAVVDAVALYSAISHFQPQNKFGIGTSDILVSASPKAKKLTVSASTKYSSGNEVPHKRVFPLRNQEFFPDITLPSSTNPMFELPADVLMDGLESVSYAASTDMSRMLFTGTLMCLDAGKITLFATDGVCLAEYTANISYSGEPIKVLLPGAFAAKVAKSFFDNDMLSVVLTKSTLFVSTPNLVLGGRLIGEEYPDYKSVLPQPTQFACLDKHLLLDNLVNLSYEASSSEDARVTMRLSGGEASLVCGASTNEGIPVDFTGDFSFHSNLRLFVSSIKNIPGNKLKMGFIDSSRLISFSSAEDSSTYSLSCVLVPLSER